MLALGILSAPMPVAAETYDLMIWRYCAPGTFCGFNSDEHMRGRILDIVHEMNVTWKVTGMSFRPIIMPINDTAQEYYETTGCVSEAKKRCSQTDRSCQGPEDCPSGESCDCNGADCVCEEDLVTSCSLDADCSGTCDDLNRLRRRKWQDEVALNFPQAISMMITEGRRTCCSNVANDEKAYEDLFGVFCNANIDKINGGSLWAHEMGHHYCLSHTFRASDWADTTPDEPKRDHDLLVGGVTDTDPDACTVEGADRAPECELSGQPCDKDNPCGSFDVCDKSIIVPGHEFCSTLEVPGVDDGSPRPAYCVGGCFECPLGGDKCGPGYAGNLQDLNIGTDWHHMMSYYAGCKGPYVINGQRTEAISPSSRDRIHWCRDNVQNRMELPEVCGALGGDFDSDGICGQNDNCPFEANTSQLDTDGDGLGDLCDSCPEDAGPDNDLDLDEIGDLCDDDIDGDTCKNEFDRRPRENSRVSKRINYVGCFVDHRLEFAFENEDSDGDGVLNCWDVDDDNDGLCDDPGSYPPDSDCSGSGPSDTCNGTVEGCTGHDPCPYAPHSSVCVIGDAGAPCPPIWESCFGGGCQQYRVRIHDVINPADLDIVVDDFQIWNQRIFMTPPPGMTTSELAVSAAGLSQADGSAAARGPSSTLRMDLELKESGDFVEVILDSWQFGELQMGVVSHGPFVRLDPVGLRLDAAYSIGPGPQAAVADTDQDGRPDWVDNCLTVGNFSLTDADADGFGNLCDADLNNDEQIDEEDVEAVNDCVGAVLNLRVPILEPLSEPGFDINGVEVVDNPDEAALDLAEACRAADLNDDGLVDDGDVDIVHSRVGTFPGPSGVGNLRPIADAGPDRSQFCSGETPLDASASFDPEGVRLRCTWASDTCAIGDPGDCQTTAVCPAGQNQVSLVVSDGQTDSLADQANVQVDCPGDVPPTVTLDKVTGSDTSVLVRWEPSCAGGGQGYGVFEGDIGDWYSHRVLTCGEQGSDLEELLQVGSGNHYYLVVPWGSSAEGSYGRSSSGAERPRAAGATRCASGQIPGQCPP